MSPTLEAAIELEYMHACVMIDTDNIRHDPSIPPDRRTLRLSELHKQRRALATAITAVSGERFRPASLRWWREFYADWR